LKNRIREIRVAKGITTCEMAEKAGITRATLWRIESNNHDIRISTLRCIADVLGVTVNDLFLPDDGQYTDRQEGQ
jgi:transcriptional regulator with XRE-family HTH domain